MRLERVYRRGVLARIPSIKTKLSIVIVAAVAVSAGTSLVGLRLGWPLWVRPVVAGALGLVMAQLLAKGMTRPLREMAAAAGAIAGGDYAQRVHTTSIDEVGRLAEAFNTMAAVVEETDRQRRDLVANVSHELRTPLSGLQATLENLIDGVAQPDPAVLGAMATQTQRLSRLVSDLLDLSRLESGALQLREGTVAIADLFESVRSEVGLRHPDLVVTVAVRPPSLAVTADAERLHQALTNLVDNAAQHGRCAAGEPVAVHLLAGGAGAAVELRVVDDGPGVPEEERELIFERFYRADRSRAPSGGAGLGLAIARWVVELHGGSLRCLTPAGTAAGTEMLLTLPARTPTDAGSVCSSAAVGTPQ